MDSKRLLFSCGRFIVYLGVAAAYLANDFVTRRYFLEQDAFVLIVIFAGLVGSAYSNSTFRIPDRVPTPKLLIAGAVLLVALLWAGTYAVMFDYPLTRDEHMAVFDAHEFSKLSLVEPLAHEWRAYSRALVPDFAMSVPDNAFIMSSYMPVNAMMRAAFGFAFDPALLNPILAGLGLVALYRIALRLFPDCPGAVWISLGAYVLSSQVLVNAMTSYAMTAHLSLNLIWLWLFLKDKWWSHAGAMGIAIAAIGLHQIIFHPLFAGPFILTLVAQRRFGLFAAYSLVYACALLGWMSYPNLLFHIADVEAAVQDVSGGSNFFTERVLPLLTQSHSYSGAFAIYNVDRTIAWAPAFSLPLLALALPLIRRNDGLALSLAGGIAATFIAMVVLLAYQGHGWGYRYIHGVMGNVALLAGYGYRRWAQEDRERADSVTVMLAGLTALVIMPFLMFKAHEFVKPHARFNEMVEATKTDFVVVDVLQPDFPVDQVRNLPDLSNRPLVFSSAHLTPASLRELCNRGSITFMGWPDLEKAGYRNENLISSNKFHNLQKLQNLQKCIN